MAILSIFKRSLLDPDPKSSSELVYFAGLSLARTFNEKCSETTGPILCFCFLCNLMSIFCSTCHSNKLNILNDLSRFPDKVSYVVKALKFDIDYFFQV